MKLKKKGVEAEVGKEIELQSHPLGTDSLGRDILARVIQGGRISLFIGIVAPLIFVIIGILIGGCSGYFGGKVDNWIMRITDFVIALPFLLFMILFKVILGNQPGSSDIGVILFALVILSWTGPLLVWFGSRFCNFVRNPIYKPPECWGPSHFTSSSSYGAKYHGGDFGNSDFRYSYVYFY